MAPAPSHAPSAGDGHYRAHFRAYGRRAVSLAVILRAERAGERHGWERSARILDIHLAGAGIETDEPLAPGDRVSVAFATPTLWDPLVLAAVVMWSSPAAAFDEPDALGRVRGAARAGLKFDYPTPDAVMATFEMLQAIGYE